MAKHHQALRACLDSVPVGGVVGLLAELARDELGEVVELTEKINALARRMERRVRVAAPTLLAMPGVGPLTAGRLVGEAAGVGRFKSETAFARHSGIAPIPVGRAVRCLKRRLVRVLFSHLTTNPKPTAKSINESTSARIAAAA